MYGEYTKHVSFESLCTLCPNCCTFSNGLNSDTIISFFTFFGISIDLSNWGHVDPPPSPNHSL